VGDVAAIPAMHARHDRLLVAAQADRPADRERGPSLGRALLAACAECAGLQADLSALAGALPSAATPRRTRDFTLTAADAERLRRRGWRRWLALVGSSRDTLSRPLAIGFTTLGLAGVLVATAPSVLPMTGAGSSAAPIPTDTTIGLEMAPAASADGGFRQHSGGGSETTGEAPLPVQPSPVPAASDDAGRLPVVVLSGTFLALGGGLFVIRRRAVVR